MKMHTLYQSDGIFQIWSYSVSHGQLLLRSTKSNVRSSQIDILFSNVSEICIPTSINNIKISVNKNSKFKFLVKEYKKNNRELYDIYGMDCEGYIIAGSVVWDESDRDYYDSSILFDVK